MIYSFKCECGLRAEIQISMAKGPPKTVRCKVCRSKMERDWQQDAPMLDTSACRDHNDISEGSRVASGFDRGSPEQIEHQFKQHIDQRRTEIRDAGGQRGTFKQTHAVPAHLYHGKIKETKDPNYWQDPKNLSRHKECKVD